MVHGASQTNRIKIKIKTDNSGGIRKEKMTKQEIEAPVYILNGDKFADFDTFDGDTQEDVDDYITAHNDDEEQGGDIWPDSERLAETYGNMYEVREWSPNGRARKVATFEEDQDAELYLYERWDNRCQTMSYNVPSCFNSIEEAREVLEERRDIPRGVNVPA
jgi:hypothetical protein